MYNKKLYKMVDVYMDKYDTALENLIEDLPPNLYRTEDTKTEVHYRGLLRLKDVKWLDEIRRASPYGNGYRIEVEGEDLYDLRCYCEIYRELSVIRLARK